MLRERADHMAASHSLQLSFGDTRARPTTYYTGGIVVTRLRLTGFYVLYYSRNTKTLWRRNRESSRQTLTQEEQFEQKQPPDVDAGPKGETAHKQPGEKRT